MPSVSDVAVERISGRYSKIFEEELERLLNLISTAKLQPQNPNVNTLNASALVNNLGGSFAKIGTIDYLCWAKRKMFLFANRNVSDRK